jgi:cell division protein ZipA
MDKELLRIVIVLVGVLVMIGMLLWHFFKSFRQNQHIDDYDDSGYDDKAEDFEPEFGHDEFEKYSHNDVVDGDALLDDYAIKPKPRQPGAQPVAPEFKAAASDHELPKLIEFSLVARADQGFNGTELINAFNQAGLKYGSVRVFERVDKNRLVDYAVASMVEPGTFPDHNLEDYYCPGIVFFMQPREVDQPLAVFDDFIETIDILAEELDGVVWDHQKQPLTAETINQFRQNLAKK